MSINKNGFQELLEKHHLKKTQQRLSVLSILANREAATSQPDLESVLGRYIDRVTLYRILKTFEEKGIIHKVLDSNGTANYALCSSGCSEEQHRDEHVHFNCTVCDNVYCLDDIHIPPIQIPAGFQTDVIHLIVSGICDRCAKKR